MSGPFAIAARPGGKDVYVLNAANSGLYVDGSVLQFAASAKGALAKGGATVTPRLGSDMLVSPDGKWLVAAYSGDEGGLRFFNVAAGGAAAQSGGLAINLKGRQVGDLTFFTPKGAAPGEYYLAATLDADLRTSRTLVMVWNGKSLRTLLQLPDDLPGGRPDGYDFGTGTPFFIKEQNLFVTLPQGATGVPPDSPNVYEFAKGTWNGEGDLRIVSATIIDFEKYLTTKSIGQASAFAPLIFNDDGQPVKPAEKADSPHNATLAFRAGYSRSHAVNATGCFDTHPSPDLPPDAALVAYDVADEILRLDNWSAVKSALAALPDEGAPADHKKRIVRGLGIAMHSRTKKVAGLDGVDFTFSRILTLDTGTNCVPMWGRIEQGRNSSGSEVTALQTNVGRSPVEPLTFLIPDRGAFALTLLGNTFYTSVFSNSAVNGYRFSAPPLTKGAKIVKVQ